MGSGEYVRPKSEMPRWLGQVPSEASAGPWDQAQIPSAPWFCSFSLLPEDEQREKSVSHQTVQQLVLEKEQALADLNSVEKSLADLFRRYEKMKEVLEGFRKVCFFVFGAKQEAGRAGFSGGLSSLAGELDLAVPGYTCVRGFSGLPKHSSAFLLWPRSVLCPVRMKRC